MSTVNFIQGSLKQLHRSYDEAIADLSPEQLHWRATDTGLPISFILWHYVRTEDNIVQFILQARKPTVWIQDGYFEKFGLHKIAQGTGMSTEDAQALRLPAIDEWMAYQQAVWQATDDYISSLDDQALDQTVKVQPFGEIKASMALGQVCLTHGHAHFGEICNMRVLQGLPSRVI